MLITGLLIAVVAANSFVTRVDGYWRDEYSPYGRNEFSGSPKDGPDPMKRLSSSVKSFLQVAKERGWYPCLEMAFQRVLDALLPQDNPVDSRRSDI